ncbi:MAG: hypothetical protein IJ173_12890 [Kiritimatiellae bacterium]|nr:hypothetical protein [Kiritimatiellia bacterium]MBQ8126750.1 hypothetical protein [Kiritimatiellia bacterium]
MNISERLMKVKAIAIVIFSLFVLACSQKQDVFFSLEEANACLWESDKDAVREAVEWIQKAEATEDEMASVEYFEKAYEPINELYAASRDDDSITGRKRSAALAWVLIDFSYNHATGSCAKWVLFAQRLGLKEADQIVADPPEKLRNYLLPPERQAPARR